MGSPPEPAGACFQTANDTRSHRFLTRQPPAPVALATRPLATAVARSGARGRIAHGVDPEARHDPVFVVQRQHLAQQWIGRIAVAHARDEGAGHAQRKLRGGGIRNARGQRIEAEQAEQLPRIAHGVAPERLPARGLGGEGVCGYHVGLAARGFPEVRTAGASLL